MTTAVRPVDAAPVSEEAASRAFSVSMLISAVRCLLSYIVFPWVLPALHVASSVGPVIGLVVGPVALLSNVLSIRRFHRSGHRWRWHVTALNVSVIVLVSILLIEDVADLL